MADKIIKCSICGAEIHNDVYDSHNADPFKGRCCNECNLKKVIPTRVALSQGYALLFKAPTTYSEGGIDCITHPERLSLKDYQSYIEGYVEPIHLSNGYVVLVNEEGQLKGLPINKIWSKFYLSDECVPLVGNVLLMKEDCLN